MTCESIKLRIPSTINTVHMLLINGNYQLSASAGDIADNPKRDKNMMSFMAAGVISVLVP